MPTHNLPFANRSGELKLAELEKNMLRGMDTRSLTSKVLRQVFYKGRRVVGLDVSRIMLDRFPLNTIYHSPFFAIPNYIGADRLNSDSPPRMVFVGRAGRAAGYPNIVE